jgi:hypothetical protein
LDLSSITPAPVALQNNNSILLNTNQSSNFLVDGLLNSEPVINREFKKKLIVVMVIFSYI